VKKLIISNPVSSLYWDLKNVNQMNLLQTEDMLLQRNKMSAYTWFQGRLSNNLVREYNYETTEMYTSRGEIITANQIKLLN